MLVFVKSALTPVLSGAVLAMSLASVASAEEMLGTTDMITSSAPGAHVMTFYVSANPGEEFPLHSHGGDGIVLMVKGQGLITYPDGRTLEFKAGDVFEEKAGEVHGARITGDGPAEFIWTTVLPDGAELEIPYSG